MDGPETLAQAALRYAAAGWPVFPCQPGRKVPLAGSAGYKDATTDPKRIAAWWAENPRYNVAISTGDSGLVVLDVDPVGLAAWENAEIGDETWRAAVDAAPKVRTPRGGFHAYLSGVAASTSHKIAPGIDTRSAGGYVLAPPSVVDDGKNVGVYAGDPLSRVVPPAPPTLLAAVARREDRASVLPVVPVSLDHPETLAKAKAMLQAKVRAGDVAVEGEGGDDKTYAVACAVLEMGISPDAAENLLAEHWNPACRPPWLPGDLRQKVLNAWRYGQDAQGGKAETPLAEEQAHLAAHAPGADDLDALEREMGRYVPALAFVVRQTLGEYKWLLPKIIPEQGVGVLYGPPGTMKTFLALDLALSLATGYGPNWWRGEQRQPRDVIYLAGESAHAFQRERMDAWFSLNCVPGLEARSRLFVMPAVPPLSLDGYWPLFRRWVSLKNISPVLVVVDTLSRGMIGLDENSVRDMGKAVGQMERLAEEFKCFVLALHHTGKSKDLPSMRGSSALDGSVDTLFELKRPIEENLEIHMFARKQKEGETAREPLVFRGAPYGATIALSRDWDPPAPSEPPRVGAGTETWMQEKTIAAVLRAGPLTTAHLAATLAQQHGVSVAKVRKALMAARLARYRAWVPEGDIWRIPAGFAAPSFDESQF